MRPPNRRSATDARAGYYALIAWPFKVSSQRSRRARPLSEMPSLLEVEHALSRSSPTPRPRQADTQASKPGEALLWIGCDRTVAGGLGPIRTHQGVWASTTRKRTKRSPAQTSVPASQSGRDSGSLSFWTSARSVAPRGSIASGQANKSMVRAMDRLSGVLRNQSPWSRVVVANPRCQPSYCTALVLHCMKELHTASSSSRGDSEPTRSRGGLLGAEEGGTDHFDFRDCEAKERRSCQFLFGALALALSQVPGSQVIFVNSRNREPPPNASCKVIGSGHNPIPDLGESPRRMR